MAVDTDRLNAFLGRFVSDLGATVAAGGVVVGHRLGLYRALADGPATPDELAGRTGTHARYVAEWLRGQAAGGYVEYDAGDGRVLADRGAGVRARRPGRPALRAGGVRAGAGRAAGRVRRSPRRSAPAPGMGWHEHARGRASSAASCSSAPATSPTWSPSWIPALDGVEAKLAAGARVADVGCGLGASTVLLAQAYPNSHVRRLGLPRRRRSSWPASAPPRRAWRTGRRFEVATAQDLPGTGLRPGRPRSTACTTWATRSARPGTSARRSRRTAPG